MQLWNDGRSGAAGCTAGNLALANLRRVESPLTKLKGTTFESAAAFIIGRVCATDEYLREPILHWANASWDQHVELKRAAQEARKELIYLFITASNDPPAIRYWRVPADAVEAAMVGRGKNRRGEVCAIHIAVDDGRHLIGKTDVTRHCTTVKLDEAAARELHAAFEVAKRQAHRLNSPPLRNQSGLATFDIPASGAGTIRIQARLPLRMSDVARLKRWIDLTADVLTENAEADESFERNRLGNQIQAGLDELQRGDTVDGEEAFDRILNRRRARREARR